MRSLSEMAERVDSAKDPMTLVRAEVRKLSTQTLKDRLAAGIAYTDSKSLIAMMKEVLWERGKS